MEISGTLTLHGVTRPTVLVATYNGGYAGLPNMDPQARVGFSARGSFRRSDLGIAYGIPALPSEQTVEQESARGVECEDPRERAAVVCLVQ